MLHMKQASETSEASGCARAAPVLLAHLSMLFVMYSGVLLATGARLKWDPSTYVAVRELLPLEYRAACVLLPLAGLVLLALAHLALVALTARAPATRRTLYTVLAVLTAVMVVLEVAAGAWGAVRVRAWLQSDMARRLQDTLEVRAHLMELLAALERWHPLPNQIKLLLEEAESDLPWNGYVASAASVVLLVTQLAAIALALLARTAFAPIAQYSPRSQSYSVADTPERLLLGRSEHERHERRQSRLT